MVASWSCRPNNPFIKKCKLQDYIYMGVSKNNGTPRSSILIYFNRVSSLYINHPFWWVSPYFWKHPYTNYIGCSDAQPVGLLNSTCRSSISNVKLSKLSLHELLQQLCMTGCSSICVPSISIIWPHDPANHGKPWSPRSGRRVKLRLSLPVARHLWHKYFAQDANSKSSSPWAFAETSATISPSHLEFVSKVWGTLSRPQKATGTAQHCRMSCYFCIFLRGTPPPMIYHNFPSLVFSPGNIYTRCRGSHCYFKWSRESLRFQSLLGLGSISLHVFLSSLDQSY